MTNERSEESDRQAREINDLKSQIHRADLAMTELAHTIERQASELAVAEAETRASIVAFLEREITQLSHDLSKMVSPAAVSAACARQAERLGAQVGIGRLWAAQIARGDDRQ